MTNAPFVSGGRFLRFQNKRPISKPLIFCLACGKGPLVTKPPKPHWVSDLLTHWGKLTLNRLTHRVSPQTHWVMASNGQWPMDPLGYLTRSINTQNLAPTGARVLGCAPTGARVLGAGVLGVRLGVLGFLGEGVGPTEPMVRLRWHHRTCEIFLKLKTQWVH